MRLEAALQLSSISKEKRLSHRQGGWARLSPQQWLCWRTERSGVSITTLRALVGGRVVVFNTRAYFVSFAILGLGLLCAC